MPKIELCFGIKTFLNRLRQLGLLNGKEVIAIMQSFSECSLILKDIKEPEVSRLISYAETLLDQDLEKRLQFNWQVRAKITDKRLIDAYEKIEVLCDRMGLDSKAELVQSLLIRSISGFQQ